MNKLKRIKKQVVFGEVRVWIYVKAKSSDFLQPLPVAWQPHGDYRSYSRWPSVEITTCSSTFWVFVPYARYNKQVSEVSIAVKNKKKAKLIAACPRHKRRSFKKNPFWKESKWAYCSKNVELFLHRKIWFTRVNVQPLLKLRLTLNLTTGIML